MSGDVGEGALGGLGGGGGRAGGAQAGGIQFPRPQKKNGAPAGPQARWENKQSPASLGLAYFREER